MKKKQRIVQIAWSLMKAVRLRKPEEVQIIIRKAEMKYRLVKGVTKNLPSSFVQDVGTSGTAVETVR